MLEQNFGTEYPAWKFEMLFEMIRDENWSEERFNRVLKWFLKTKYNQAWSISDWFQYDIRLYPFQWVRNYCTKNNICEIDFIKTLDCYLVDDVKLYKIRDGIELPLEKIQ